MTTNNSCNFGTGSTGQSLNSNGAGVAPTFQDTFVKLSGSTMTGALILNADPVTALGASTKQYVDNAITAVNPATSVVAATTTALTVTYFNGVSGVGATLTNAGTQAAFSIDGQSPTIGQRVLIKDQGSTFQNGVYTVTLVGSGATNWILTRALDYDQPSDINNTGVINVVNGTLNALTGWLINSTVATVGTDAITYVKYNNAPGTVTQYATLVGGAASAIASVGPSATARQMYVSNGNAANPSFTTETWAVPGTSGNLLQSDGTNWTSAAPIILQTSQIPLSNAQIKALNTTPVQIIAAPGSGKIAVLLSFVIKLVYGGNNAFTGGGNIKFVDGAGDLLSVPFSGAILNAVNNNYFFWVGETSASTSQTNYQNSAVNITCTVAYTGNAANDNTALVVATYYVLTL